jgi:uncharacterized protein
MEPERTFTAFAGHHLIATCPVEAVLRKTKHRIDAGERETVLLFEDRTGAQIDFDFRGNANDVVARLPSHPLFAAEAAGAARSGPGRPRLGVVSREVTLLPRHWEFLEAQPSGISAALRRLVEDAIRRDPAGESARRARDAAGRFMSALAGDLPGFEEASRALYAGDRKRLAAQMRDWPADVRAHVARLLDAAGERPRG